MIDMTLPYNIESVVDEDGTIHLPKSFQKHRVKLVVYDLEAIHRDPVEYFQQIVQNYNRITDEPDLDIEEIYREREQSHEQRPMFT